jgi:diacylglycerol O-acyltransferase
LNRLTDVAQASPRSIVGGNLWGQYQGLRRDPAGLRDYASVAAGSLPSEIGSRLALMPDDSHGRVSRERRAPSSASPGRNRCRCSEIKAVGRALSAARSTTLLLASVAGAHAQLSGGNRGNAVEACRDSRHGAGQPARQPGDSEELGNRFGLVALELPLASDNPLARLYATRARMESIEVLVSGAC